MKKKIALLLTVTTVAMSLLAGCGGNSQTETTSESTDKKVETMSECLLKEKVIGYMMSGEEIDKADTPDKIYFFEDGKFTIMSGDTLGLTLGDLSRMDDKEIWKTYEQVRISYAKEHSDKCDLPFSFAVFTDTTGNTVKAEQLVAPKSAYLDGHINDFTYSFVEFDNTVEGGTVQVYDSTYNCYPLTSNYTFCTRASFRLDVVDSNLKNILIDPTDDELNELYK